MSDSEFTTTVLESTNPEEETQGVSEAEEEHPKTSGKKKGAASKKAGKDGEKKKHPKMKPTGDSYSMYIHRVLRQVHPETGINKKAMGIMDSFCKDLYGKITTEASQLAAYSKRTTVTDNDIKAAVRLIVPGELSKHAGEEAELAVAKYDSTVEHKPKKSGKKKVTA